MRQTAARRVGVLALIGALLFAAAGCHARPREDGQITLTVSDFGNFGYKPLLVEYRKLHPNIRVVERTQEYVEHHTQLAAQLDADEGAGDVVAIEEAYIVQFRDRREAFHNLLDFGAETIKSRWLEWKWQQSLSVDGKIQIGLGTDIGGLGMCYRRDLFARAGLPADREAVSELWPTWEAYLDAGRKFQAASTGAHWVDSSRRVFEAAVAQQEVGYYDLDNNVVLATNKGVRYAFDLALRVFAAGESSRVKPDSAQWVAALQSGRFATMMCPAWGLGKLRQNAPDARGKWDLAAMPGGGGNWGGSFLAIPKQTRHPVEAYQLAVWLTSPAQQLRIFRETGNLPSQPALYQDPALQGYRSEYLNDAPIGQIYGASAAKLRPQYMGPKSGEIKEAFIDTLMRVETGAVPADRAWATALSDVMAVISN